MAFEARKLDSEKNCPEEEGRGFLQRLKEVYSDLVTSVSVQHVRSKLVRALGAAVPTGTVLVAGCADQGTQELMEEDVDNDVADASGDGGDVDEVDVVDSFELDDLDFGGETGDMNEVDSLEDGVDMDALGKLVVSLSPDTPGVFPVIPTGAQNVFCFDYLNEAQGGNVPVDGFDFDRTMVGDSSDIESISIWHSGGYYISDGDFQFDDVSQKVHIDLTETLMVDAGETVSLTLVIDIADEVALGEHRISLTGVETEAEVFGLPLEGPAKAVSTAQAGQIIVRDDEDNIDFNSTVEDNDPLQLAPPFVDGSFEVFFEDTDLETVWFRNLGSGDLKSLDLYFSFNNIIVTEMTIHGDLLKVEVPFIPPFTEILEDDSVDFKLSGVILDGEPGTTYNLVVEDVCARGRTYGYCVSVQNLYTEGFTVTIVDDGELP